MTSHEDNKIYGGESGDLRPRQGGNVGGVDCNPAVVTVMGLRRTAATAADGLALVMVGRRPIYSGSPHVVCPKFVVGGGKICNSNNR